MGWQQATGWGRTEVDLVVAENILAGFGTTQVVWLHSGLHYIDMAADIDASRRVFLLRMLATGLFALPPSAYAAQQEEVRRGPHEIAEDGDGGIHQQPGDERPLGPDPLREIPEE